MNDRILLKPAIAWKFVWKILLFLCMLMTLLLPLYAQVSLHFENENVSAESGNTVLLRAIIVNHSRIPQNYRIGGLNTGIFQTLNTIADSVHLGPGDSTAIPVLLYVPRKADASKPYPIQLNVLANNGNTVFARCFIHLKAEQMAYLTISQPDIYLTPGDDTVHIPVQLHNGGNVPEQVIINISEQLTNRQLLHSKIALSGFTDTIITFNIKLPSQLLLMPNAHILVTGNHENGQVFSTVQVNIFNTSSQKHYTFDVRNEEQPGNDLGLYVRYLGTNMQYYELLGKGLFNMGKDRIGYDLDALYYPTLFNSSFVLMNTHLSYLTNKWNIQVGNIYRNDEMLLNGRGVAFQLTPSSSAQWDAGYLNNNYNLAGKFNGGNFSSANTFYTDYSASFKKDMQLKGLFIQQWDPDYYGNSTLGGGSIGFNIHRHHHIQLGAYTSYHSKGINLKDSSGNWGGAATVSYSGTTGKWQMESYNYISTPSYAGFQKGAVNLMERVSYTSSNTLNFWATYNKINNHTEYLYAANSFYNPSYANETAELGMNRYLHKNLLITLRPYYSKERSENDFFNSQYNYAIRAAHLNLSLNYTAAHKQNLYLNADGGWSWANLAGYKRYFAWKIMARYQLGPFSINTSYQNGPYYSGELALYQYTSQKYRLFMISPAFNGYLFHSKVMLSIYNALAYENSYQRWTNNISLNITYHAKYHFDFVAAFNKVQYFMDIPGISQFDLGIVKRFNTHGRGKRYNLILHFFGDENGNDQWDKTEKPTADQLVQINHDVFRTDKAGEISYKRIPSGNYHVSVLQSNGTIATDTTIGVHHKTNAYIPMHKIGMISGHVELRLQQYSYNTDESVAGITIVAIDKTGKQIKAITDAKGNFSLYVPLNSYTLQLEISSLPEKYICPKPVKSIDLTHNPKPAVIFVVLVKQRKVEVKKFISSN